MALTLGPDFDAAGLKRCACSSGKVDRYFALALAAIYDGASRAEAAEIGGVTRQIVRDWVVWLNEGRPEGGGDPQSGRQDLAADVRAPTGPA